MFPKVEVGFVCSDEPNTDVDFAVDSLLLKVVVLKTEVGCVVGVVPNTDVGFAADWLLLDGVEPKIEVGLVAGALVFPNVNSGPVAVVLDAGWVLSPEVAAGGVKPPRRLSKLFDPEAGLAGSSFF